MTNILSVFKSHCMTHDGNSIMFYMEKVTFKVQSTVLSYLCDKISIPEHLKSLPSMNIANQSVLGQWAFLLQVMVITIRQWSQNARLVNAIQIQNSLLYVACFVTMVMK